MYHTNKIICGSVLLQLFIGSQILVGSSHDVIHTHGQMGQAERWAMIRTHNSLRKEPTATNMRFLMWDSEIEDMAQTWTDHCDFRKNPNVTYGQNLRSQPRVVAGPDPPFFNETTVILDWYVERTDYTYSSNTCSAASCSGYLQLVLADTQLFGCGITHCDNIATINLLDAYLIICFYDLGVGNSVPYEEGSSCINCPAGTICEDRLCRTNPVCGGKSCYNGGQLWDDICECNCIGTGYDTNDHLTQNNTEHYRDTCGPAPSTVAPSTSSSTVLPSVQANLDSGAKLEDHIFIVLFFSLVFTVLVNDFRNRIL